MVRNYKRKSDRGSWSIENMEKAVKDVSNKVLTLGEAAAKYEVPKTTLFRRTAAKAKGLAVTKNLGRHMPVFTEEQESQLCSYILQMEERLFGLTPMDIRKLAFQLAEKSKLENPFNKENQCAGPDWFESFMKRNKTLSLRKPEATSYGRAVGFNKPQVERFFKLLEECLTKYELRPERIYNMDETGLTVVQKPQRIVGKKGKKQVGALTSAEKGRNVTAACCVSAAGHYVPPFLIFPRKTMRDDLLDGSPPGTVGKAQENGWMNSEIFVSWLSHFIKFVRPTTSDRVLLILDGHCSHKSIEALDLATENGVVVLCLPPHSTHRLQPLDRCFFGPLMTYYDREISKWLRNHPGRTVSVNQIAPIFASAYGQAARHDIAVQAFSCCGICPFNPEIFSDADFAPSLVTDQPQPDGQPDAQSDVVKDIPGPSTSSTLPEDISEFTATIQEISPLPKAELGERKRKGKRSKAEVLTSTPVKNDLRSRQTAKQSAVAKPKKLKLNSGSKKSWSCIICGTAYTEPPTEDWIQCSKCNCWAHENCAEVDGPQYICDLCI